jgi:hypothetical protein
MSQFISLRILASLALGHAKEPSSAETPGALPVVDREADPSSVEREEPSSASRISVGRVHAPS